MSSFLIIFAEKRIAMPKISIILPIYNVAPYLDDAFQSLLNQTYSDFEIIAVNDGSTDNSLDVIKKYATLDKRIKYISQTNQGQSAARNFGMQYANGDYIYFMDADDKIEKSTLKTCFEYIERTKADFIFFDGETFFEDGAQPISWNYKRTFLCKENTPYSGEELLKTMLDAGKHNCVVWLLMIRKVFLHKIGLTFYPGIIHEDELYTVLLTLHSNHIYCLHKTFVHHRIRRSSTMGKTYSKRNINCYLTVIDELHRFQDSPIIRQFSRYTLSKVFYTGHIIPFRDKPRVFFRALKSGYLKYIGWKSCLVFWLK